MTKRVVHTLAPDTIQDLKREMARLRTMVRNTQSRQRMPPTLGQAKPIRFRLTESLTTGGSAAAIQFFMRPDGTKRDGRTIEVSDPLSIFEGSEDDEGYAWHYGDSGKNEIIQMVCAV